MTVEDVFGSAPAKSRAPRTATASVKGQKGKGVARYRDSTGRTWTGMGPKPQWLKDALAAGQSLDALKVNGGRLRAVVNGKGEASGDAGTATATAAKKTPLPPKYKDAAGHTWTGRGPKPRWLQEAIASGMTLEQLAA